VRNARKKRIVDGVDGWPVTKHDCLGNKGAKWWVCECPKCKKHYKRFLFWKGNAKVPRSTARNASTSCSRRSTREEKMTHSYPGRQTKTALYTRFIQEKHND